MIRQKRNKLSGGMLYGGRTPLAQLTAGPNSKQKFLDQRRCPPDRTREYTFLSFSVDS